VPGTVHSFKVKEGLGLTVIKRGPLLTGGRANDHVMLVMTWPEAAIPQRAEARFFTILSYAHRLDKLNVLA
jgi:hypothetical protein